tara:strand:- start:335 stop:1081 length:747 start_codon:yes stop_codon:yes gene_type:complete
MAYFRFDPNNYSFNSSSEIGVYILHGFSSTTFEVKELAEFLGNNGYHAVANNLPGHGTNVDDCNRIKYNHWFDKVKMDVAEMSSKCNKIFIIGNSMGSVLTLYLASIFPISGFIVGGTVLKFKNHFTTNYIVPLVCSFLTSQPKNKMNKSKNVKFYGYEEYPLKALNEFRKMNYKVISVIKKIQAPGMIIHSHSDRLSNEENVKIMKKNLTNKNIKTLYVNRAHHNMFDDNPDQKLIFNEVLQFLNSH